MKNLLIYIFILALATIIFYSCKKDNYKPPSALVTGQLNYKGDLIGVEYNQVTYQLYQRGYSTPAPIIGTFDQDGKLSVMLFPGNYKFYIPNNQGPFLWKRTATGAPDSLSLDVTGNMQVDIPVTPYYMIRNLKITSVEKLVNAAFKVEKIITDDNARNVEFVALYINKTQFVSQAGSDNIAKTSINVIPDFDNVVLSVTVPDISPAQNYVFARVGVKIVGIEDMLLSPVIKINL